MTRLIQGRRLITWLAPALLLGTLALAACGAASTGGTSNGGTPDAATILKNAKAVTINDETYSITLSTTAAGQTNSITIQGKATKNPKREQLDLTATTSGTNTAYTLIQDAASNADYVKFTDSGSSGLPTGKWIKMPDTTATTLSSGVDALLDYSAVTNPKLIGSEEVNGVAVWHLQATQTIDASPNAGTPISGSGIADLYFRKDNSYPVKVVLKSTGMDASTGTITWAAVNSGLSIALPDPKDVTDLAGA
jgi:hypothetical protein